jgi:hypothetical protein
MAEQTPVVKTTLPAEVRKRLTDMAPDIEESKRTVAVLKKLGMDTTVLDEKIRWAEETKDILLKEFG